MRLLLGGAFDPPHAGHLFLAREARRAVEADEVVLAPSCVPPHKEPAAAGAWDRFAMTALLASLEPGLVPDPIELERGGPSYSVDTLDQWGEDPPAALIVGADMLADFATWRRPERILELTALIAFPRGGIGLDEVVAGLSRGLAGRVREAQRTTVPRAGEILLVRRHPPKISSTELRSRLAAGEDPGPDLPGVVADYVRRRGLYRRACESAPSPEDPT